MALLLILLFIVVPIAELYVLIKIGMAIGVLPTIGLLILDSVVGAWLMRSQGRAVWLRFNRTLAEGRIPGREVMDGVLVIFGGALLLTPGFLSDVLGVILLLPPTRALVRKGLVRRFSGHVVTTAAGGAGRRMSGAFGFGTGPRPGASTGSGDPRRPPVDEDVVEGTAREVPPRREELP